MWGGEGRGGKGTEKRFVWLEQEKGHMTALIHYVRGGRGRQGKSTNNTKGFSLSQVLIFMLFHRPGQLRRTPLPVDAGGARGTADEDKTSVALVHDLPVVADLAHVRAVLVEAHRAHQQDFAVLHEPGEGAEHCGKQSEQ